MALVFNANAISLQQKNKIIEEAESKKIYNSYTWKSLLHKYSGKNDIDDKNFWLSPDRTLKSELIYTIKGMYIQKSDESNEKEHVLCRFPARVKYIVEELNIDKGSLPNIECKDFDEYINKISAKKIYISYASENILSPMSMMGHMFIKIVGFDKITKNETNNALSYYANFDKNNETAFEFYFKSLFIKSNGTFNITPYRQKLIEYNDIGSRNIYDYELNLNQNQIEYLIYHIWELKGINVPYNFINHNCGAATIKLLSVVDERFNSAIDKSWATPVDILKKIYSKGLISNIIVFPSDAYKIQMFKNNFSNNDYIVIKNFIFKNDYKKILDSNRKNELLFMSDISSGNYLLKNKITNERYKEIQNFVYKNFDGMDSIDLEQKTKININSPFSSAVSLRAGKYKTNNGINISFYPAYRNIEDDNSQYFNDFSLNLLNINSFIDLKQDKFVIKNFDLINVKSIIPSLYILPSFSFNLKTGYQDSYEKYNNHGDFVAEIGLGKSYSYKDIFTPYLIMNAGFFKKPYIKLDGGIIFKIRNNKLIISYNYFIQNNRQLEYTFSASENIYLNDRLSLNFTYEYNKFTHNCDSYYNISSGIKFYF